MCLGIHFVIGIDSHVVMYLAFLLGSTWCVRPIWVTLCCFGPLGGIRAAWDAQFGAVFEYAAGGSKTNIDTNRKRRIPQITEA